MQNILTTKINNVFVCFWKKVDLSQKNIHFDIGFFHVFSPNPFLGVKKIPAQHHLLSEQCHLLFQLLVHLPGTKRSA